jgi:hypothetical protein
MYSTSQFHRRTGGGRNETLLNDIVLCVALDKKCILIWDEVPTMVEIAIF